RARGDEGADGGGVMGAVDAVHRLAEIERARTERIGLAACHEARQIGLAHDHLLRRIPIRPLRHPRDLLHAGPSKALAADADPVTQRLAVAEHEIEVGVRRIDDDRARRFLGVIINDRATELWCQLFLRASLGPHVRRQCRHVAWVAAPSRSGHRRIVWFRIDLTGADRHPRSHRFLQNFILFGRTGCAGWDAAGHAVVWLVVFGVSWRPGAGTPLSPLRIWPAGCLVGLRFRDSARWERTALQIVNHFIVVIVIDDRRKRTITLPRIVALWRISLRWRIGLSGRVVLRRSLLSRRSEPNH